MSSVSADRKTTIVTSDLDGDGKNDNRIQTVLAADGKTVTTGSNPGTDGVQVIASRIEAVSANGLSTVVEWDANGVVDSKFSDVTQ
ncbi:hypothetical protein N182_36485 [Sinorhizobium sp. GL2]|nr:hypothetical protein N182_36485 [Sinorhizobium sp. GL2]